MPKKGVRRCPLSFQEIRKRLIHFGFVELPKRGKGSHRAFFHPHFRGKKKLYPVPYHGAGKTLSIPTCEAIRKNLDLTEEEFY